MQKMGLAWAAAAVLVSVGAPVAQAGVTCRAIPALCPPEKAELVHKTSVPEPATLLLLGAGVSAVGAAVARRRRKS